MELIIGAAIFFVVILVAMGIYFLLRSVLNPESKRIRQQLRELSAKGIRNQNQMVDITRKPRSLSDVSWLNQILLGIPSLHKLDHLLQQSKLPFPLGVFLLASVVLAFTGFFFSSLVTRSYLISLPISAVLGVAPFFYLSMKVKGRIKKFERQLPEALDLIARSLKAGHAFSGGLQMVAEEFSDPISGEFAKVLDEINFGVGVKEALTNLVERVDCADLKLFVIAIAIQRETGGDLCEILEKISRLIRERFKLQGRIRTLSAEGKLSAAMLVGIPIFVALAISVVNPDYIRVLVTDTLGKMLISFSLIMMFVGVAVMKKIIAIKV